MDSNSTGTTTTGTTNRTEPALPAGAILYKDFYYAPEDGRFRIHDTAGAMTENILRSEALARLCIDGKVARSEALAAEHAAHAAHEEIKRMREGALTPQERLLIKMGRKANNASDLI